MSRAVLSMHFLKNQSHAIRIKYSYLSTTYFIIYNFYVALAIRNVLQFSFEWEKDLSLISKLRKLIKKIGTCCLSSL